MTIPGYSVPPATGKEPRRLGEAAHKEWVRHIAEILASVMRGRMNVVLPVTMAVGATSTTIIDARIGPFSALLLQPLTANAAALLFGTPYVIVASQQNGQATFDHASTANDDQNFNLVILG